MSRGLTLTRPTCAQCVKLQDEILRLRAENKSLKEKLRYQQRQLDEGYFGSSTPSSKKPFKATTTTRNNGGAKSGHRGFGRASLAPHEAEEVIALEPAQECPECHVRLESLDVQTRTVAEVVPARVKHVVYQLARRRCPCCRRVYAAKAPGVLPKCKLSNSALVHVAVEHYLHQVTLGRLAEHLQMPLGTILQALHHLARLFHAVPEQLLAEYRQAPVKHADETVWRNDGRNGYAWLFCTTTLSIFRLRLTRAASVAQEVFGEEALPGTLVCDRYAVYRQARCFLQYCYAHLLRLVQERAKEFPDAREVQDFALAAAPLLAQAIRLRALPISNEVFYARAEQRKSEIEHVMHRPAQHAGVQSVQNIFRENAHRLYHWARDRAIPADNNFAERELRKLVIARKVSFASQAEAGAKTRETLMTVLLTLEKRGTGEVRQNLQTCLDELVRAPAAQPFTLLFATNPPRTHDPTPAPHCAHT